MAEQKMAIGVDIGAQSVKMVRLGLKGGTIEVLDSRVKEYLKDDSEKGTAINSVLEGLKDLPQSIPVVMSVEGSGVFIRVFKLPGVAKSKLAKIIAYEAQQQVPFPADEVVWNYQCLRRVSPEETDVVLSAVRANSIRVFLDSIDIDVISAVPTVIGLNNFLNFDDYGNVKDSSGQAVIILDLGAKTTNVIIVEKNNLWFRTIPMGGDSITQAIANEYHNSFPEAEMLKREKGEIILEEQIEFDSERKRMSTCIIRALTRLTGEISRSIEVYSSSFNSLGPRKMFITGGSSKLRKIDDFFCKKFRMEVIKLQIREGSKMSFGLRKEDFSQNSHMFGTALGLALEGLGFGNVKLNLLPKEILQKYKWINLKSQITMVSGLLVVLGIFFSGYNLQMARIYKAKLNSLESEKDAVSFNKKKLAEIRRGISIVEEKLNVINGLNNSRTFWLEMILELENLLPENVWLTGIGPAQQDKRKNNLLEYSPSPSALGLGSFDESGIITLKLSGKTTGTYQDVVKFSEALNNSKYILKNTAKIITASPPEKGERDFVIEVKAGVAQ